MAQTSSNLLLFVCPVCASCRQRKSLCKQRGNATSMQGNSPGNKLMEAFKHYFAIPFVLLSAVSGIYSLFQFFSSGFSMAWLGASIAVIPTASFFVYLTLDRVARTGRKLPLLLGSAIAGTALTLLGNDPVAFGIAFVVGFVGSFLYVFWYSPLDRSSSTIHVGQALPAFTLTDTNGQTVSSDSGDGRKKVWMFIRGNWCPLCMSQVAELADAYKKLQQLGADVFLVSSQSEDESRKLARRFDAPIRFLIDKNNHAARALGIEHIGGVPFGMRGYDIDTAMPTVVITDENNTVIFADQTDNYRIRPEPEQFIKILSG